VNAVIPIEIRAVEATIPVPVIPAKSAEATHGKPMDSEPVAAEVDATKSVESTEMATEVTASVTTTKVTTAAMATAGIRDLRQCNHARDQHRGQKRDKLHDTLLLDGDLLVVTEALRKWRS
jgi:hypothetical protein